MEIYRPFSNVPVLKEEDENAAYVPYVLSDKLFTAAELSLINAMWDEERATDAKVYFPYDGDTDMPRLRKSKKQYIHAAGNEWIYDKIGAFVIMMNATKFKFRISGFQGPVALNAYEPDNYFTWHMDYGAKSSSNRKLVVCIQMSDASEYEGGELQLINDITVPKEKGSVVVFPSYVVHRVAPTLNGCRKSLVAHIAGPPFR